MLLQTNLDSLQAAADAINSAAATPVQQEMNLSLISMATKGGPLMVVLLILSIVAIFIFGKKWWMIRQANVIDKNFMNDIRDYIHDGKIKSAITLCQRYDSPIARLVEKGLSKMGHSQAEIRASVENTGNIEVARLEKGLSFLATTAGGAPMIGFLGTVIGMIQAFFNMSQAGNNIDITLLSSGIYTAMVTTVGGLIVGILADFGYNFLSGQISTLVYKMENTTMDLMDLVNEPETTEE